MAHLTLADLETQLGRIAAIAQPDRQYAYVETGRFKPYMPATVEAARRKVLTPELIAKDARTHIAECEYTLLFANTASSLSIPTRSSNSGTRGASWSDAPAPSFD